MNMQASETFAGLEQMVETAHSMTDPSSVIPPTGSHEGQSDEDETDTEDEDAMSAPAVPGIGLRNPARLEMRETRLEQCLGR